MAFPACFDPLISASRPMMSVRVSRKSSWGGVLATVAVPLLTITSTADLERRTIDPILGQGFTLEKTRADATG